jgi:photosystem II stability/assembly factor-like uncharacterized protein
MVAKLLRWSLTVMLALALTPLLAIAQTFTKIAPVPTGADLWDVWFTSPDDGWVAGVGHALYRTTDHGLTWTFVSMPGNPDGPFYAVRFVSSQLGFVAGNSGLTGPDIYKTTDRGTTWQQVPEFPPGGSWSHIQFVNETTGFMGANGALVRTNDAGTNWLLQSAYPDCPVIYGMDFLDANTGLVAGHQIPSNQNGIFKTNDGGQTWQLKHFGLVSKAIFLTDSIALAADGTSIIRSTDGGETWSAVATVSTGFGDIEKLDSDTVVGLSEKGDVWRSPDGGFTWSQQWSGEGDLPGSWRVHFLNPLIGHISGQAGAILGTNDGGLTWTRLNRGIARDWNGLIAFSDSQVILVGHHGYVQSTRDAGAQWTPLLLDPPSFRRDTAFSGISIADATTAVVVGHWGSLFKTVDQGATWMNLSNSLNPGYYANAVTFNDANNGWIAGVDENGGPRSHIRRTYDGGLTWETASLNVPSIDIRFINQTGYVLTTSQPLYQTTDGGATWTAKNITGATTNERMSWASDNIGYVGGWQGFLAKTTDGGDTWSRVRPAQGNALYFDVMAVGENEVWACGIDRPQAVVIRSLDGGSTWTTWFLPEQYTTPYRLAVTNSYVYVTGYVGRTWLFDRQGP